MRREPYKFPLIFSKPRKYYPMKITHSTVFIILVCYIISAATKVHHFLQLASNIRAKQALVKTTPYKVVTQWVQLGMAVVLLTLVTSYLLHFHPSGYWGLAFVLLGGMAGAGALAIFLVVRSVHNGKTYLCLEANLTEIKTLLTFHTVARAATVIDDCTDMGTKKES